MYGMIGTGKETDIDKRITTARDEGYRYYFDISDLIKNKKGQNEILTIGTVLTLKAMRNKNTALCVQNMKIMYVKESDISKLRK